MARTHSDTARDEKIAAIIAAARNLFVRGGFDATSMGRIAERAKVAPNTLYWYFSDKDSLLVAVLDAIMSEQVSEYEARRTDSLESQMNWVLDIFDSVRPLITTVHARSTVSEQVRDWHDRFHELFEKLIEEQLQAVYTDARDRVNAARFAMFAMEGLISHPLHRDERQSLVKWLCYQRYSPPREAPVPAGKSAPHVGRARRRPKA